MLLKRLFGLSKTKKRSYKALFHVYYRNIAVKFPYLGKHLSFVALNKIPVNERNFDST